MATDRQEETRAMQTAGSDGWASYHPDSETLAAFMEGRLGGDSWERTVDHLADCEDCREVLVGAVEFDGEERERRRLAVYTFRRGLLALVGLALLGWAVYVAVVALLAT